MRDVTDENLLKFAYNIFLMDAFTYWATNKDKSFLVCFKESLKKNQVQLKKDGLEFDMPARDVLKMAINTVKQTVVVQQLCYAYELLDDNYDPSLKNDKSSFDKLKANVLHNASKSFNNEQLLNHIRNSISHNDDSVLPSYDYSMISELFTFLPTKKKRNNDSTCVTISENELVELMTYYMKNMNEYKQLNYVIETNIKKIKSNAKISILSDFIKLRNIKTNEYIVPDVYQKEVIKEIIQGLRNGYIKENDNLNFFYPYKQNSLNNFLKTSDFYHMLNCLYKLRSSTFEEFINKSAMYTPNGLREFKNFGDISSMFIVNRLFQIFSTTDTKILKEHFNSLDEPLKITKLRNAIMHGTYFKDFDANIYIYDGSRPKTEENLQYIDKFIAEEQEPVSMIFYLNKHSHNKR